MTTSPTSLWTALIPFALVVALSPLSVIPAVLVLGGPRPRATGLGYLIGWLMSLTALTMTAIAVAGLLGENHRTAPTWASWLRIVAGSALIAFGVYRWANRKHSGEMPRWLSSFATMSPLRAAFTAAALTVVRPEVLGMCAAAGVAIRNAELDRIAVGQAAAFFVALAASTVLIPIVGYLAASHRLDPTLNRLKVWMEQQHAALVASVLVLIGAMVLYNGMHAL